MKNKKIFLIGPHTDDIEFCMGGTVIRLMKEYRDDIFYITFSYCQESIPRKFSTDSTKKESYFSAKKLGILKENIIQYDFPVRNFPKYRQEILEKLIFLKKRYDPDTIFSPSVSDIHQDHKTIAEECIRAYKDTCSIFGYETPKNNFIGFNPQMFIPLDEEDVNEKIELIKIFKSQTYKYPNFGEYTRARAKFRGNMIKEKYAEAFDIPRLIMEI